MIQNKEQKKLFFMLLFAVLLFCFLAYQTFTLIRNDLALTPISMQTQSSQIIAFPKKMYDLLTRYKAAHEKTSLSQAEQQIADIRKQVQG